MIKQKALIYVVSLVTIIASVFVFDARVMGFYDALSGPRERIL